MFETIRQALKCRVFVIYKCGVYYNGINTLIGRPGTWLQVIKMWYLVMAKQYMLPTCNEILLW